MSNLRTAHLAALAEADHLALGGFGLTLKQAIGADRHLRAHCACGRHGPVDTSYWIVRGWGDKLLIGLIDRVRCTCGGRRLEFVVGVGPAWPSDTFYQLF